jgi:hypothetical protein
MCQRPPADFGKPGIIAVEHGENYPIEVKIITREIIR